ncbi:hypothetical protein [Salicibibacter kimchii]|uniref:ABC transporter permease n=1 Tax=Salicibibacter kimchii TaxID=2099786 RepID=A0A345C1Q2_9BACI|nr:hypothetical protein [Salicibibacter kimchii]AXF57133.1 hypothetical protein DT065_14765 [Salicibibacter kimchii]
MEQKPFTALIYKEINNLRYNGQFFVTATIPLIIYVLFMLDDSISWTVLIVLTLIFLPLQIQGNLLVEEKEQQTWRILEQQGISLYGLTLVKALLPAAMTLFLTFLIAYSSGLSLGSTLLICIFIIPALFIMLSIGTIIAVYANNKIEVIIWEAPIIIIFISLEIINQVLMSSEYSTILSLFPYYHFIRGLLLIPDQPPEAFSVSFLYTLILSLVFVVLAVFVIHKRKQSF